MDETVLRCRVAGHDIAFRVADVVEVHRAVAVTPLPDAPEGIVGVVDVRGELVPVLDLRLRLGLTAPPVRTSDAFVAADVHDRRLLILVEAATGVEVIPADRLHAGETIVPGARYVSDIAATPGGPLVVHDLAAFLSSAELTQLDAALRDRAAAAEAGDP